MSGHNSRRLLLVRIFVYSFCHLSGNLKSTRSLTEFTLMPKLLVCHKKSHFKNRTIPVSGCELFKNVVLYFHLKHTVIIQMYELISTKSY